MIFWPIFLRSNPPARRFRQKWESHWHIYATAGCGPNPNVQYWVRASTGRITYDMPPDVDDMEQY